MNKKPDFRVYLIIIVMSFLLGIVMRLGGKTIDYIWPDNNEIKVINEYRVVPDVPENLEEL